MSFTGIYRGLAIRALAGMILLGGGGGMIWKAWRISEAKAAARAETQARELFTGEVGPLVDSEAARNQKALQLAQARLHDVFQRYRKRAPHFADELARWGVKWKLMKSSLHDWWDKDNESSRIAQKTFSDTVFSEAELKRELEQVMKEFAGEMEANRNRMLLDAHALVSQSHLPLAALSADQFSHEFNDRMRVLVEERAKEMPQAALLSAAGGFSASLGAGYLAEAVATMLVRWAATAATTAGGSTVGGAVVGGGGGSVVGPWGTVIGVTAGLIVGGVVDWVMEARFKDKVIKQTVEILDGMEKAALSDKQKGLRATLERLVDENRRVHEGALNALAAEPATLP